MRWLVPRSSPEPSNDIMSASKTHVVSLWNIILHAGLLCMLQGAQQQSHRCITCCIICKTRQQQWEQEHASARVCEHILPVIKPENRLCISSPTKCLCVSRLSWPHRKKVCVLRVAALSLGSPPNWCCPVLFCCWGIASLELHGVSVALEFVYQVSRGPGPGVHWFCPRGTGVHCLKLVSSCSVHCAVM